MRCWIVSAALALIFGGTTTWAQTPTASVTIVPPPTPPLSGLRTSAGSDVGVAGGLWSCNGFAASPEPWYTSFASLTLKVNGQQVAYNSFTANYWGQTGNASAILTSADYDRTVTCEIYVTVNECGPCGTASAADSAIDRADCGDERTTIINEYRTWPANWSPRCSDFTNTGGSPNFSWNELNGGFGTGNPHIPWGHVNPTLTNGLEGTRISYSRGGIRLSSGYRCPHGNNAVGGVPTSFHVHGRAADMYSADNPWTQQEFDLLKQAALTTAPTEALFWETYADHHLHVGW